MITGGAGYIGSTLSRLLVRKGYDVKVLDRLYFGKKPVEELLGRENFELIQGDVRYCSPSLLEDVDVVIGMAALSNDPAGEINPDKTWDINYLGRSRIARIAKIKGVERYIQASSCSIYGQQEGLLKETSEVNPLTTYAKAHRELEKDLLAMSTNSFTVTILRQATVYGLSHRMRFDLAINGMVGAIYDRGTLGIMRDGTQWRPFVHVKDTSRAFAKCIETPSDKINGEVFNVGSNDQNYQIKPLGEKVMGSLDFNVDWEWYGDPDDRSYRADFAKIHERLNYEVNHTPSEAAQKIYSALEEEKVKKTKRNITVDWYKHILESEKLLDGLSRETSIL